ncbi:MAG TPA: large conductance mechanosensitive channel protein MscL [Candidatus Omnitrophota bacterium]|nr:MAG: Large-conductance mechanosensitive channel [Candidatus Omnitrophica bacterium ADurb.Bin314]HOE69238.1 large conductance mechanosensitive channel protein MscL [Candidatus Omnitrophota bacterium]HQB94729.1 large conductance mechanosensitive channel protein MscL [Candidatus Omnitrophota bacterium]
MKFVNDFKQFVMRGNVVDMAVGVIIGGAFGKIVTSLVNDVIMPPIGLLLGKVDFANLYVSLNGQVYASLAEAQKAGAPTLNYGLFLNTVINFLIVAFVIFIVIRQMANLQRKPAPAPAVPTTKECPFCCSTVAIKATRCPSCTSQL